MKIFAITLLASIIGSVVLWNFGVARRIWPLHPYLATVVIATIFGILVQSLLQRDAAAQVGRRRS